VEAIGGSANVIGARTCSSWACSCAVFQLDKEKLVGIISRQFGKKDESVLRNACWPSTPATPIRSATSSSSRSLEEAFRCHRISTDGNQMLTTMGLLAAGVRYGAAYPITPWSSIMETLRSELPKYGGIYVQAEDELAAVCMTIGAGFAGHLAITGSSGPGLSLKMEALSYASMAEIPLIVVNVQRGGPSTGLPTSVEQSDLMQAIYGSHGDCTAHRPFARRTSKIASTSPLKQAARPEYSCPVIILSDQALSSRIEAFTSRTSTILDRA
jgi:2-oxoglutarate ferredoxin oxidoreductase subunit alpha